jgi:hypothetical protein
MTEIDDYIEIEEIEENKEDISHNDYDIASLNNMKESIQNMSKFNQIENFFKEIDEKAIEKLNIYIIGGAVLLFRGLKGSTKDIDIITKTPKEREALLTSILQRSHSRNERTDERPDGARSSKTFVCQKGSCSIC